MPASDIDGLQQQLIQEICQFAQYHNNYIIHDRIDDYKKVI